MTKYLLDANIFDEILKNTEICRKLIELRRAGLILFIGTWIEASELTAISSANPEKWLEMSELLSGLEVVQVPVAGMILNHSKISETALISWSECEILGKSIKQSGKNENDMAIAMTAKRENATLVTNDLEMQKKAKSILSAVVIDWAEFASKCMTGNL